MAKKTITIEGKNISYESAGQGSAVVLLHGFGADNTIWKEQIDYFSPHHLVIAPDLPGVNSSELLEDLSMKNIATLVLQIIKAEDAKDVVLIGHSMGGYIALAFAAHYPNQIRGFGLFHSSATADNDEKKAARIKGIEFVSKNGSSTFLATTAPKMFGASTKNGNSPAYQNFLNTLPAMSNEAITKYYEAMMARPDTTHLLQSTKLPVLFIYGLEDEIIELNKTIEQASMPSISFVNVLKKSGHLGMIEEPQNANRAIEEFLSDI